MAEKRIVVFVGESDLNAGHKEMSRLGKELAWKALAELTGESVENLLEKGIRLAKKESGQPVWQGIEAYLSITHTANVAAAAAAFVPIGIDLEERDRENLRVAQRMFSQQEVRWMQQEKESGKTDAFAALWTLRESYAKWTGLGLAKMPPVEFSIDGEKVLCSDEKCISGKRNFFAAGSEKVFSFTADKPENGDFMLFFAIEKCEK